MNAAIHLSVVQVFGIETLGAAAFRRRDDDRVVILKLIARADLQAVDERRREPVGSDPSVWVRVYGFGVW